MCTLTYPVITQFSAPIESADGRADHAVTRGSFDMTVETEDGETRMVGKWLATYREEGGRWRVATDCWNFDAPRGKLSHPPCGSQERVTKRAVHGGC